MRHPARLLIILFLALAALVGPASAAAASVAPQAPPSPRIRGEPERGEAARPRPDETPLIRSVSLSTRRPEQGRTVEVRVVLNRPATLSGEFRDQSLRFSQNADGVWWALLAIGMPKAQAGVGLETPGGAYDVSITAASDDGETDTAEQTLWVTGRPYTPIPFDPGPEKRHLLDIELRTAEATRMWEMFAQGTPDPLWQGMFWPPINVPSSGGFMVARSYPDGTTGFHEGLDYATAYGAPVRAAAHGVVALAEPLGVRGNAIYIDHGAGVFSGYFHLSQILVEPGQVVEPGQLIGRVGSTGLSTGPHLHFEIRVNGYNVSPWQWLTFEFP